MEKDIKVLVELLNSMPFVLVAKAIDDANLNDREVLDILYKYTDGE